MNIVCSVRTHIRTFAAPVVFISAELIHHSLHYYHLAGLTRICCVNRFKTALISFSHIRKRCHMRCRSLERAELYRSCSESKFRRKLVRKHLTCSTHLLVTESIRCNISAKLTYIGSVGKLDSFRYRDKDRFLFIRKFFHMLHKSIHIKRLFRKIYRIRSRTVIRF